MWPQAGKEWRLDSSPEQMVKVKETIQSMNRGKRETCYTALEDSDFGLGLVPKLDFPPCISEV